MKLPINYKAGTSVVFMFLCCMNFLAAQPALPIFTENACVIEGEEFCVDITTNDFVDVESFQFSMSWDSTLFDYESTVITDVPDPAFFGFGENFVDEGILTVSWNADFSDTIPATVSDGTSLFQVCFTAIGTPDTCSTLNFVNLPLGIEVVTAASNQMDIGLDPTLGQMCIVEQLEVIDTIITQASCGGGGGGAIDIIMNGGLAPYNFTWEGTGFSAVTEDIDNLLPGMYYLTVTDASLPEHVMMDSFEIVNPQFSIAFAGVDTVLTCANPIITLFGDADPINNDVFVEWYTTDGNILTDPFIPFVDIDMPGTYCYTTLVGSSLCADTSCLNVDLNNTAPIANAGMGGALTCDQTTLTLDASGSTQGPNLLYVWTPQTGILSGDSTQTPVVDQPGIYTLTVLDTINGCPSSTASVLVTQDAELPLAVAGTDTLITCEFPEINLNGTGSTEIDVTYSWFTLDGNVSGGGNTLFPSVDQAGTYGLVVTNTANCSDTSYVVVNSDMVGPTADAGEDQVLQCGQFLVLLDGSASDAGSNISYNWTTIDGIIIDGSTTPVAEAGAGGTYEIEVINDENGCSSFSTVMVTYDTIAPTVNILDAPTLDCNVTSIMLDATGTSTGTEFTYEWNTVFGNIVSGSNTLTPTVDSGGVYVLLVQNLDNSCLATGTVIVMMDTIPPLADPGIDTILQCEQPLTLDGSNSGQGAGVTYLWQTNDGNIVSGETTLSPTVDLEGTYFLITMDNNNGCSDTASVFVDGGVDLVDANVGMGFDACEDSTLLMGNLPMNTFGMWTTNSTATILDTDTMDTWVMNMSQGANVFVWTLSTDECPDYDTDTLTIQVEGQPLAEEDMYTFFSDLPVQEILLSENDDVSNMISWDITFIDEPSEVVITETEVGIYEVTNPQGYFGLLEFEYALCSATCPDICDTTLVTLNIEEAIDTITQIANAITPNDDGKNDVFIIPEISMEPEKYPDNELIIFNRWGDIVYRSNPYFNDWRGTDKDGNELPQGTYYYQITLTVGNAYQGDITILK